MFNSSPFNSTGFNGGPAKHSLLVQDLGVGKDSLVKQEVVVEVREFISTIARVVNLQSFLDRTVPS